MKTDGRSAQDKEIENEVKPVGSRLRKEINTKDDIYAALYRRRFTKKDCEIQLCRTRIGFPECSDNQAALFSSKIIGENHRTNIKCLHCNVCNIVLQAPLYSRTCSRPRSVCGSSHCPAGLSCSLFVSHHLFFCIFFYSVTIFQQKDQWS